MLDLLAQSSSTYNYTYTVPSTTTNSGLGAALIVFWILGLIIAVIVLVSMWKVFEKAGEKGWKVLIPFYNSWIIAEIAGKPGYWGLASLLGIFSIIPVLGWLLSILILVVFVVIYINLAKAFGKDTLFGVLLIVFPFICFPILGFGDAKYVGKRFKTNMGGTAKPAA